MTDDALRSAAPTYPRRALRSVLAFLAFTVAGLGADASVVDDRLVTLVWPAAGVAAMWIASGNRWTWVGDVLALGAATVLLHARAEVPAYLSVVVLTANLLQIGLFTLLARRHLPWVWGFGGTAPLRTVPELGRLLQSGALAALLGVLVGATATGALAEELASGRLGVWWGRNTIVLVIAAVVGVLIGQSASSTGSVSASATAVRNALTPTSPAHLVEAAGLVLGTCALVLLLFLVPAASPLAFLLLSMSVWSGLRFSPITITVHGLAMGATGLALTMHDRGPFAVVESTTYRAGIAQAFVMISVLTGLALAFGRAQRDAANEALATARQAADERAQLLDAVLESLGEGLVVIEEGGRVLVRNHAALHLLGFEESASSDEIRPASEYGLFHPNGTPLEDQAMPGVRALSGETVPPEDFHVRSPALPHGRVLEISARPVVGTAPNAPRRALVNLRDVTVDRQHRDALASFAGVVAHDLLNPLTIITGWTEALQEELDHGPLEPVSGKIMTQKIGSAAAHMRAFISDLISYTISRDQSLHREYVDVTALARKLARLRTQTQPPPSIVVQDGLHAWADTGLVRQLLDNLIGNAVKYVSPGVVPEVRISGTRTGDWIEIAVTDNGIGIAEDERDAVFEQFYRAQHSGYTGTGLGLAICRRIVDRHGGSLRVGPGPNGVGSTFSFQLPLSAAAADRPDSLSAQPPTSSEERLAAAS